MNSGREQKIAFALAGIFFVALLFTAPLLRSAQAIRASSTSFIVPLSELISISGPSTSTSFKLNSAGGQQATGISTSTSYKAWAGILYSIFGDASSPTITVSGTVYKNEGITPTTSTIKLAVNGSTAYTGSTNASGVYTITGVTQPAEGDVLTVWMNNDGGGNGLGASVNRYSGTGNVTNFHIYKDYLITRHDDAGPLTNTNIGLCDSATGSVCADSDLHFDESGGALTVQNDWGLYLWGGDTFTPGGAVTLSNTALPVKTPAYVQSATEYTTDGVLAYSSNVTGGNLLIAVVSGSGTADPSVSDSLGNSWTDIPRLLGGGGGTSFTLKMFYTISTSTGANTVTITGLPADQGMSIYEYSGIEAVSPLDNSTSTFADVGATATTTPTVYMTTQRRGLLFLAFADETTNNTFTAGSGFTLRENTTNHVDAQQEGVFDPGPQTASFTLGTSVNTWGLYLAAFKAAHYPGGDIVWASSTSVISVGNNDLTIGGDWRNAAGGTFTSGSTHTTTFTATTTGFTIQPAGSFRRVTFNGSNGGWYPIANNMTIGAAAVSGNNLTMTAGTLSNEYSTSSITVINGNVSGAGGVINLTNSTFTAQLVATTTANFGQTSGSDWTFKDLVFTNASTTASTFQFTAPTSGSGNVSVSGNLQIISSASAGNTTTLYAGNRTWTLSGSDGIPFHIVSSGGTATFDSASSTVAYTGSNTGGNTTMASTTYWTTSVGGSSGETYVFGTSTTMNNNLLFSGSGDTLDTTGVNVTVNNNYIHTAGTLSGTGNVTVKGGMQFGAAATVNLTGGTFEHLISATTTIQISTPLVSSLTFNNLKMNNSVSTARTATLTMAAPSSGFTVSNDWTIGDNSSSTYIFPMGGGITALTVDVNNDTTFSTNASVLAATSTIRTARNLTVTGALTPASSTFQFDTTATSTIVGSTSLPLIFNNFFVNTANKPLVFSTSTAYFEILGLLTLTGTSGNEVTLDSNASGTQWLINHQGTESVEYVSLKDSGCIATSTDITITSFNVVDRGNNDNPCWLMTPTIAVSGTVYSDEGATTATSTVTIAFGGSSSYTTSTDGSGVYTFPALARPATSSVITVWLDNGTTTKTGATVTRYIGSGDLTNFHIYQNRLITRHEDSGPLTNTNIGVCDSATGSACADSDLHFNEASGNLTVDNDWALYIWGGDTFTPGGNVTLSAGSTAANPGGDLKWASSTSVLDIAGNSLSVGGDWLNAIDGTFTRWSTSTATFTATQSGMRIVPGTQMFASTTFNGSGGTWSASGTTMSVAGNVTMTAGTVDNSAGTEQIIVYEGDVTGTGGAFNFTTSTFRIDQPGSGTRSIGASGANWTFYNLTMRNTSTTSSPAVFSFVGPNTVTTTISRLLTVGNTNPLVLTTRWDVGSSNVAFAGSVASPLQFVNSAGSDYQSSTIAYTGNNASGDTSILSNAAYWNLVVDNASETYVPASAVQAKNDLTVNAGTLDTTSVGSVDVDRDFNVTSAGTMILSTNVFNVGRNFTNSGTYTAGSSTIIFDTTVTSTITGTSTFWSFTSETPTKPLVFKDGNTFLIGGALTLTGSSGNLITVDSTASGTQWLVNHQGTEAVTYVSVKDSGCVSTSTYISVSYVDSVNRGNNGFCWAFPSLSFTISPLSLSLGLNSGNSYTDTETNTLTVTTNGEFGYNIQAHAESLMTHLDTSDTIAAWTGTNATPTTWNTTCIAAAACGFGYSTDDTDLTQFSATKFAGFTTSTPGDVVATASSWVTSDATTITYRASVDLTQPAGDYQTIIRYIVSPRF